MSDACGYNDRMKNRTVSGEDWDAAHAHHGEKTWKPLEAAPEGYAFEWKCCPCGAQNLRRRADDEASHD